MKNLILFILIASLLGCTKNNGVIYHEATINNEGTDSIVPVSGGKVGDIKFAQATIAPNTFSTPVKVTITKYDDKEMIKFFDEMTQGVKEIMSKSNYFIKLSVDGLQPNKPVLVDIGVPAEILSKLSSNSVVQAYCQINEYSENEDFLDFLPVPTIESSDHKIVQVSVEAQDFVQNGKSMDAFIILVVAPKPFPGEFRIPQSVNEDECYKSRCISPLVDYFVTSNFALRRVHPVLKNIDGSPKVRPHNGSDLRANVNTLVHSVLDGDVLSAGTVKGFGNLIKIQHALSNGSITTYYAHLNSMTVKPGQHVKEGELIGLSGKTGNVDHEHLHFEMRYNNIPVDPNLFTNASSIQLESVTANPANLGQGVVCLIPDPNSGIIVRGNAFNHVIKYRDPYNKIKYTQLITQLKSLSTSPTYVYDMAGFDEKNMILNSIACKASNVIERAYILCKDKSKSNCVDVAYR
ncbi:M23 family metallopeptidase [Mucilaginibacter sp.]|uniref:M23 family metallopeptidase n=1 Tax=Mucilaginibacter sp. TaxID=1882438 RepID=UPI0035BC19A8